MNAASSTSPWHGCMPLFLLPTTVLIGFPSGGPAWGRMWSLAVAVYLGCKWLTWRQCRVAAAPVWKHAGYLLAWPGLDAQTFLQTPSSRNVHCSMKEWLFAGAKLCAGFGLLCAVARAEAMDRPLVAGWMGMVGIVLTLHFGLFHLLSCAWRAIGVDARPLMNQPLTAANISEFWGRRWNTAFRDLTNRFLFRPVTLSCGATVALLTSFAASGLVHDLVISVPARAGYGGPTLYFVVQGLAILVARSSIGQELGLTGGVAGRLFAATALLAPLSLLFHAHFVTEVVLPFMHAVGVL